MTLKKVIKEMQSTETINKAKLEYYASELAKKEQEVIDLLDVKKGIVANGSGSGGELEAVNLKIKAYKLEMIVKRKEVELKKLKGDLKVSDMKELKAQNERLRAELAKALMNDARVLEGKEVSVTDEISVGNGGKVVVKQVRLLAMAITSRYD